MKRKYVSFITIPILVMVLSFTACSEATEPSAGSETVTPANETVTTPEPENNKAPEPTRPQTESFDLMTGEGDQPLTAALQQGDGFSLYVFEKFDFDASEGRLFLTSNPEYNVEIEPLPADYDLTQLRTAGKEELEAFGEVSDYSGELVEHPLGYAEVYLQVSNGEGIRDYMVWKSESGDAYLFRLRNPKGEEASDFAGPVLVSLSTVQK
ncbi:hypothetical protein KB559_04075 [Paenibacillus sp. Marseille-P2973]|uniref:hypothetical protein n=1 Tax=Paenibacillus sp. Marseille-P2973 TaxID=1871032 RepID=UPI001B3881D9|nr:hypothetical protein [Paenibacillus sp. Marseille-P2973]MBQ4898009.1 hypothetical protein [Paenibacillus sp. Marseille-P2973]